MKREDFMHAFAIVVALVALLLIAMGSAGAATYDATGTWSYTTGGCSPVRPEWVADSGTVEITQSGDSFTMIMDGEESVSGTIAGAVYTATHSNAEESETYVWTLNPPGDSGAGSYTYSCSLGSTTCSFSVNLQGGTSLSGAYNYYVPYYRGDGEYYSSLALRNSSDAETATVTIIVYNQNGSVAQTVSPFTLAAAGQWAAVLLPKITGGWVHVNSTRKLTGLAWVGQLEGGWPTIMADIGLIGTLSSALTVPHVAQKRYQAGGGWDTTVCICNPNSVASTVSLTYVSPEGTVGSPVILEIPMKGSIAYGLDDMFPQNDREGGSVVIAVTPGVAAFALYSDREAASGTCYAGISASVSETSLRGSYDYYLPYYRSDGDYYSSLALRNASQILPATVTITVYNPDGSKAQDVAPFAIGARGQWAAVLSPKINEGWVLVSSTQKLSGLAWIGRLDAAAYPVIMADISLIGALCTRLIVPHMAQIRYPAGGGWDTMICLCNPNSTAVTVSLTCFGTDGSIIGADSVTLAAMGSEAYELSRIIPGNDRGSGSVTLDAAQGIASFALYYDTEAVGGTCYAGIGAVDPDL
ncbi:MAG: hypothetical protein JW884_12170 [Deltaproteobacteria bacterium]|nr:hypothetical protein [Deltaproteobacteria bacterium]